MAQRASLSPKPSLYFCFFPFLSLPLIQKPGFGPQKGHLCLFLSVSLCFSLAFFLPPPFSLSLSLSLSCSFLSLFLLVFLFCFLLVPCFCLSPFLSSLLLFHEKHNIKLFCYKAFSIHPFSFLWFPVLFSLSNLFSYLSFSLIFSYVFCSTLKFLLSRQTS